MLGLGPAQGAGSLREHPDESFTFVCPASDGEKANVYGTDVYTDDSAICAAAIHAGVLEPGRSGIVTIRIGDGAKEFRGSERNGVASRSYGAWPHSYTFVREEKPGAIGWSTVWNGIPADFWEPIAVQCPTGGTTKWTIWGTEVYARDSAICVAAVHRGLINPEKGGLIVAKRAPGAKEFPGSVQNGIESNRWGALEDAFTVASEGTAAPPPVTPPPEEPPPPPANANLHPRTIVLAGFAGTGPATQAGPVLPRTITLTGFTGVGPAAVSDPSTHASSTHRAGPASAPHPEENPMLARSVIATLLSAISMLAVATSSAQSVSADVTFEAPLNLTRVHDNITHVKIACTLISSGLTRIAGEAQRMRVAEVVLPVTGGSVVQNAQVVIPLTDADFEDTASGRQATYNCKLYAKEFSGQWDSFLAPHLSSMARAMTPVPAPITGAFVW